MCGVRKSRKIVAFTCQKCRILGVGSEERHVFSASEIFFRVNERQSLPVGSSNMDVVMQFIAAVIGRVVVWR